MRSDDVYLIDSMGPYVRWVQQKGFLAALGTQGTADSCSGMGC